MNSIISNERECLVCGTTLNLHKHHIFFGANRKNADKYGCWCYLCAEHHNMSKSGVHFNKTLDVKLKRHAQKKFEEIYGHDKFMEVFKRNYL